MSPLCDSVVSVLTGIPRFVPTVLGDFEVDFEVTSDSVDQILGNETASYNFSLTDTIFARDDGDFSKGDGTGPANYVDGINGIPGGDTVGDRFATLYIIENRSGNGIVNMPTSLTYYVSSDPRNVGVAIVPKVWEYNEDSMTINQAFGIEVASSFTSYTITSSDTNAFLTLSLTNGSALVRGLDSGQYAVGWEVTSLPSGKTFAVANDASTAVNQPAATSFVYLGHAAAEGWGTVDVNPVIRLNLRNVFPCFYSSSGNDSVIKEELGVYPNPTTKSISIRNAKGIKTFELYNLHGQKVKELRPNQQELIQLEIEGPTGLYFLRFQMQDGSSQSSKVLKK